MRSLSHGNGGRPFTIHEPITQQTRTHMHTHAYTHVHTLPLLPGMPLSLAVGLQAVAVVDGSDLPGQAVVDIAYDMLTAQVLSKLGSTSIALTGCTSN